MKFIHCADLHLDSKMESNLDTEKARIRRAEIVDTFERMVEYAHEMQVRAILIAGDLFDKNHVQKNVKNRVIETVRRFSDIDFLYLQGNHDKTEFIDELKEACPHNVRTFSKEEWLTYEYGNVTVTAREITRENSRTIATNLVLDQAKQNIVMLHGQDSQYDAADRTEVINLTEFKNKNIDYLALGHIHSYREEHLDDRGVYCYSGCLEGRGFDECGEKGFVLLTVTEDKMERKFIPFAKRTLHEIHLEIAEDMEMVDILYAAEQLLSEVSREDLVKLVLDGHTEVDFDMDIARIQRHFEGRFFFLKVQDHTEVLIDYESFVNDRSLKGEFVRLMQKVSMDEKERSEIVEIGMKAIMGEEIEE